jgi:hypothetical protein
MIGFTVIVKVIGVPLQPLAEGVTVIVATTGVEPVLVAVNDGILPVPVAGRPMDGWLLVHVKVVPATGQLKVIGAVVAPLQYAALLTGFTIGVGLTVIVNVIGVPVQPFADGVTVIVATTGAVPAFVEINEGIPPVPFAGNPIEG